MDSFRDLDDHLVQFETRISPADARDFKNTEIQDVYNAAHVIERGQEQRQCMRNLRRIEPLLQALTKLGDICEPNITDKTSIRYLWGPIKLILQITESHDESFKKILATYSRLAEHLAFVESLPILMKASIHFKKIPADICHDILNFHEQTYALFRRGGWTLLFEASWKHYLPQIECVMQRLNQLTELVQKHAQVLSKTYGTTHVGGNAHLQLGDQNITNIVTQVPPESLNLMQQHWAEARDFRKMLIENMTRDETDRQTAQLQATPTWLKLSEHDQEQENAFAKRADHREADTCGWVLQNPSFQNLLDLDHRQKYLWLKGKPGSGKTTIATFIIERASLPPGSTLLYCLCSQAFDLPASEFCALVFRMFVGQILRKRSDLVLFVYEEFVKKAEMPSLRVLLPLLRVLLLNLPPTFIIVDGLDECGQAAQAMFVRKLDNLLSAQRDLDTNSTLDVKILISSRDTKTIPSRLRKSPTISLSAEAEHVSKDIKLYTMRSIEELKDRFSDHQVELIAQEIVKKANGMFLWVRLVIDTLLEQQSLQDLQDTVHKLPSSLKGLYQTILERIEARSDDKQKTYVRNILTWMVYSRQPLESWEMCAALVFSVPGQQLNDRTRLERGVLDCCKPLLEEHIDGRLTFIHFSVKEYLLNGKGSYILDPPAAKNLLSAVCVRYLLTADHFFQNGNTAKSCRDIVLGFHVLFPYVQAHWYNLLIDSYECRPETSSAYQASSVAVQQEPSTPTPKEQVLTMSTLEFARRSISKENRSQVGPSNQAVTDAMSNKMQEIEEDQAPNSQSVTAIGLAYQRFRDRFEALILGKCAFSLSELNVTDAEMSAFMSRHARGAFTCLWPECPWRITGFSSSAERDRHYRTHLSRLCCPEANFDFATFSFANKGALRKHQSTYHDVVPALPLPKLKLSRSSAVSETVRSGKPTKASDQVRERSSTFALNTNRAANSISGEAPSSASLQTGHHAGYSPEVYYGSPTQTTYDPETRKRGYDALDAFFSQVKKREFDPINYQAVTRRLFELQGLQLPKISDLPYDSTTQGGLHPAHHESSQSIPVSRGRESHHLQSAPNVNPRHLPGNKNPSSDMLTADHRSTSMQTPTFRDPWKSQQTETSRDPRATQRPAMYSYNNPNTDSRQNTHTSISHSDVDVYKEFALVPPTSDIDTVNPSSTEQKRELTSADNSYINAQAVHMAKNTSREKRQHMIGSIDSSIRESLIDPVIHYSRMEAEKLFQEQEARIVQRIIGPALMQSLFFCLQDMNLLAVYCIMDSHAVGKSPALHDIQIKPFFNESLCTFGFKLQSIQNKEEVDTLANPTQYGPVLLWADGMRCIRLQSADTASVIQRMIGCAKEIGQRINLDLHRLLQRTTNLVNEPDAQNQTGLRVRTATFTSIFKGAQNTSNDDALPHVVEFQWSPGEHYINIYFEQYLIGWRVTIKKYTQNSVGKNGLLGLFDSFAEAKIGVGMNVGMNDPLFIKSAQSAKAELLAACPWFTPAVLQSEWEKYLSRVIDVIADTPSEADLNSVLPFWLSTEAMDKIQGWSAITEKNPNSQSSLSRYWRFKMRLVAHQQQYVNETGDWSINNISRGTPGDDLKIPAPGAETLEPTQYQTQEDRQSQSQVKAHPHQHSDSSPDEQGKQTSREDEELLRATTLA